MKGSKPTVWLALLGLLALAAGCTGPRAYLHPSADFNFIKKIAVLPLDNLTDDNYAGKKMQAWISTEILRREYAEIVDYGEVMRVFSEEGAPEATTPDIATLRSAGERLGVQAFITGTVQEYGEDRASSAPLVAITLRLVDARSAQILWQGSHWRKGSSFLADLFGVDKKAVTEVAQQVIAELVGTMVH